jgi:hypothetical protein
MPMPPNMAMPPMPPSMAMPMPSAMPMPVSAMAMNTSMSVPMPKRKHNDGSEDHASSEKRKGRKKGFVWSHVVTDDEGKVSCMHCGELIKVNFGEKVS